MIESESRVTVFAANTVHTIEGKGDGLDGFVEAAWWGDRLVPNTPARIHVEIPVERIATGTDADDGILHGMLASRSFPSVVTDMRDPVQLETPNHFEAQIDVNVRGTTRRSTHTFRMRQVDGRIEIDGEDALDLRAFGIEPVRLLWFSYRPEIRMRTHVIAILME